MVRWTRCLVLCLMVLGCQAQREPMRLGEATARVHNAIDFGMVSSTHFVISRVDGVVVHRKFDRDEIVRIAPGRRELRVRFYSESLTRAGSGESQCRLELSAEADRDYYLEGVVEGEWWRAHLVDASGGAEIPCLFEDGTGLGPVVGGSQLHAVSSRPRGSEVRPPPAAAVLDPVDPAAEQALATTPEPEAAAQAVAPIAEAARQPLPSAAPAAAAAQVPARGADGTVAVASARRRREKQSVLGKVMSGRGHWGCPSNLFRVSAIEGEAIALSGDERVRLLGVAAEDDEAYVEALEPVIGECVSIEHDPALAGKVQRDREGRLLVYLVDESGALLNAEVIRIGAAKVDPQSRCRRLGELLAAQSEAMAAGRGVWEAR